MNSFSANVKNELAELNNLAKKDQVAAELAGYLFANDSNVFSTESQYNINRYGKLLSNCNINSFTIEVKGKKFIIKTKAIPHYKTEYEKETEIKAFVRGTFMANGSINNPQSVYHLEINFNSKEKAELIKEYLNKFDIQVKIVKKGNYYTIYIKDGNVIANFLAFIDANKSVLEFEDIRVMKEVRNTINRQVNYETANLNKVVSTSVKQIEDIKYIKKRRKFDKLSEKEQELAEVRLKNPNLSLVELGKLVTPEISKSGVNHRMANISKLANELRKGE